MWLITSDLHLSDRPRDQQRFAIFDWLVKQQQKYKVDVTFVLGDLTDRKDNHSSALVNRVIDELLKLKPPVYILRGNHDGVDPSNPFFRFLQTIEGLDFVVEPTVLPMGVAMIPHQPDQAALDRACRLVKPSMAGVMMHQTLDGATAETGTRLTGLRCPLVEAMRPAGVWQRWYSGDIHTPQRLTGGLTYVGAPYHVRFGDDFDPRVLLVGNTEVDLHFPCLRKWTLRVNGNWAPTPRIRKGDHVKIIVTLPPEEVVEWAAIKRRILDTCREMEVQVFGVELETIKGNGTNRTSSQESVHKEPKEIFRAFCQSEKLADNIRQVGEEFVSN